MKLLVVLTLLAVTCRSASTFGLIPHIIDRIAQSVDHIADRIDTGIQQTVNPVVGQLSQNVRDTLGIWNRPFSPLSSSHPKPASNPPQANPLNDGLISPLFQGFFDNSPSREWWKGPNICIEREEIDENRKNETSTTGPTTATEAGGITEEESVTTTNEDLVETSSDRKSRQFSSHFRMQTCNDEGLFYTCETKIRSNAVRKTYKTKYSCCYGTIREAGEFGCHEVELRSLQETVFALGGRSFLSLMKEAQVNDRIASVNHTYFVPVDRSSPSSGDAVNDVDVTSDKNNNQQVNEDAKNEMNDDDDDMVLRRSARSNSASTIARMDIDPRELTEMRTIVRSHMVQGLYLTSNFKDEQMLDTEEGDAKIRINLYNAPDRIYTANCVRMVSTNHYAQQGVVHMLDGVMKPATKTIAQLLEEEPHFSSFRKLMKSQGVELMSQPGQLTVFAPTDDAFAKLNPELRDRLMKGEGCVQSVVQQHVLGNVICSTVIQGRARSTTLLGSSLLLERDLEGKLYANGKQVITRDVMASNGVLHVIDGVLIPENARSFSQLLSSRNLTELARLVDAAGMAGTLDSMTETTLLAPTNDAVRAVPDEVKQSWISDPEKLKKILSYHLVQPMIHQSGLANNQVLETGLKGHSLRMHFYQSLPLFNAVPLRATAQCASITRWEQEACNGNVHVVDRVLIPPEQTITQWLANNRSYSIMTQLLKDTRLSEILNAEGPYTVLAPPDVAFYQMPEETLSEITKDARKAAAVLKLHILPEHLCCAGFRGDWFSSNRRRTLDGNWLPFQRHLDGSLTAGDSVVMTCDQLATNGVIHIVENVMLPNQKGVLPFLSANRRVGLPGMELIFNHGKK